ncbi:hypothetical protein HPB51_015041 [Rhipicephalus microplus]|uniref:Uncharacterized protein n=1 Tax=Rhipicephalus microplus TaxID=6941 RepID=A0A9J6ETU2_RHIMP|nr:hypothetical protein HPB51_015041 [Rhipicephalus microplus]
MRTFGAFLLVVISVVSGDVQERGHSYVTKNVTVENEQSTCGAENAHPLPAHSKLLLEPHIRDIWEELATYILRRKTWKVDSFDSFTLLDASPKTSIITQQRLSPQTQLKKNLMESAGIEVFVASHASSSIHDIDKLDPVMLAGYGERWEDTKHTSLWRACVESHFSLITHYQQNEVWHLEESHDKDIKCCMKALPELLCDKASRNLQKELDGVMSPAMWDVDRRFYSGMPQVWLDGVTEIAKQLAEGGPSGKPKLTAT